MCSEARAMLPMPPTVKTMLFLLVRTVVAIFFDEMKRVAPDQGNSFRPKLCGGKNNTF